MQRNKRAYETNEAPFATTMGRITALWPEDDEIVFAASLGAPEGPGWVEVSDLASDTGLLMEPLARIGREYGLENRAFAGTSLLRGCLWRVLTPAVAVL